MTRIVAAFVAALALLGASPVLAGDRYAVVVTGASGGAPYAQKYSGWRASFVAMLKAKYGYADDHVLVLAEREEAGVAKATRDGIQRTFGDLRARVTKDDQLLVVLFGHGTSLDADEAKFNLVGPDLSASEWADLVRPLPCALVFVDTTGGSYPFLRKLAGRGRVVLTATDSAAQQFETVFPEFFVKAFDDPEADADKNGRVSIWEAFSYASAGVRRWFEQHGHLPTERPLLDDTGAGIGREAQNPGLDGNLAQATYLGGEGGPSVAGDAALAALLKQRDDLEKQIAALKGQRGDLSPDQDDATLERLLLDLARISQQLRNKS